MQNPASQTWVTGIDVSQYQNTIDWNLVKNDPKNIQYSYIRTYGSTHTTLDTQFLANVQGAKNIGIPTGGYYYSVPKYIAGTTEVDLVDARTQAQQFIDALQQGYGVGFYGDLIPMLDLENSSSYGDVIRMSVGQMLEWANEFRTYFEENTQVKLGLYSGHWFIHDERAGFNEGVTLKGNTLKDMPLWIAAYEDQYPVYASGLADTGGWTAWTINQYSQQATVTGITGNTVDVNRTASIQGILSVSLSAPAVVVTDGLTINNVISHTLALSDEDVDTTTMIRYINDATARINADASTLLPFYDVADLTILDSKLVLPRTWAQLLYIPYVTMRIKQKESPQDAPSFSQEFEYALSTFKSEGLSSLSDIYKNVNHRPENGYEPDFSTSYWGW